MALLALSGCAGVQTTRRQPGRVEDGSFAPTRAGAASIGPDPTYACGTPGLFKRLLGQVADEKLAGLATPVQDGRLCAVAEALLGWEQTGAPPERISEFAAWYYGLPAQPTPRVVIATFPTEDPADISTAFIAPVSEFAQKTAHPMIGLATLRETGKGETKGERGAKAVGSTKVVMVLQDAPVEFQPFPRKLAPNSQATLTGRIVDTVENAKLYTSDPVGHLETVPIGADGAFHVDIKCADKAGRLQVEVRGDRKGSPAVLAAFPIECGNELPAKIALPNPAASSMDIAQQKKSILELINAERASAALSPLAADEAVNSIAQSMSDQLKNDAASGSPTKSLDPVAMLKQAEISSPLVLVNPGQALTADEAQARFAANPTLRANLMNTTVTHAGVGITPFKLPDGRTSAFVIEVFVRELPPVTAASIPTIRQDLYAAIQRKRVAAHSAALNNETALETAAQKYATALAESQGTLSNLAGNKIISPLYKSYKAINILSGVKLNPNDFAEEDGIVGKATVVGVGIAQGTHPSFGKNALYVVILLGAHR